MSEHQHPHDLDPLPPELDDLLDAARELSPVSSRHRSAVHARLIGTLGLGGPGGPAGSGGSGGSDAPRGGLSGPATPAPAPAPSSPAPPEVGVAAGSALHAALLTHPLVAVLGTFVLGAVVGAGAHAGLTTRAPLLAASSSPVAITQASATARAGDERPAAAEIDPVPSANPGERDDAPASAITGSAPGPAARPSLAAAASRPSSTTEPAEPSGRDVGLGAERALLDVARTAVGRGQPGAALDALRRHAATFPNGRLREEREALFVQALALNGQSAEATQRANGFRRAYPDSFLGSAVAAAASGSAGPASPVSSSSPHTP